MPPARNKSTPAVYMHERHHVSFANEPNRKHRPTPPLAASLGMPLARHAFALVMFG
jgi:hypothetical protein